MSYKDEEEGAINENTEEKRERDLDFNIKKCNNYYVN